MPDKKLTLEPLAAGPDTPHREAVEKSGFPFELAVARELRKVGEKHGWLFIGTEVPAKDAYVDAVIQHKGGCLALVECKRASSERWRFLAPSGSRERESRCRLAWHNPRTRQGSAMYGHLPRSRLFVSEFTMCEESYETSIAVLPRGKAAHTLEPICRDLLGKACAIGEGLQPGERLRPTYLVPVIITNAALTVCEYDPESLDVSSGSLGDAKFIDVDFVRFRKTLVTEPSNEFDRDDLPLSQWVEDRERTVFVVSTTGLHRFLSGFRAFAPRDGSDWPNEYMNPPTP